MKNLNNYLVKDKNVLLRVDLNVPVINEIITEKSRIKCLKPSIKKLIDQNNKIFLISHFGRPEGKRKKKYSLSFICDTLKSEWNLSKIYFLDCFDQEKIISMINNMDKGEYVFLKI